MLTIGTVTCTLHAFYCSCKSAWCISIHSLFATMESKGINIPCLKFQFDWLLLKGMTGSMKTSASGSISVWPKMSHSHGIAHIRWSSGSNNVPNKLLAQFKANSATIIDKSYTSFPTLLWTHTQHIYLKPFYWYWYWSFRLTLHRFFLAHLYFLF